MHQSLHQLRLGQWMPASQGRQLLAAHINQSSNELITCLLSQKIKHKHMWTRSTVFTTQLSDPSGFLWFFSVKCHYFLVQMTTIKSSVTDNNGTNQSLFHDNHCNCHCNWDISFLNALHRAHWGTNHKNYKSYKASWIPNCLSTISLQELA